MALDNDGFHTLWPTLLLKRNLPSASAANAALHEYIIGIEQSNSQLTTDYKNQNLFEDSNPAIQWLNQCIKKSIIDYLKKSNVGVSVQWDLQGWANVNRTADYHMLHNHPYSYLSGTYYVSTPTQPVNPNQRNDVNPGDISFFDPRPQANIAAIAGDPQYDPEFRVTPDAGLLMLWPSFLHHAVHPNFAQEPRISISFNMVLKR